MNVSHLLSAMVVAMATWMPAAAYDFMFNGLAYTVNADQATVSVSCTNRLSPDNYSQLDYAEIPDHVTTRQGITYRVTAIDDFAFAGCGTLECVSIPATVERVGDRALAYCPMLSIIEVDKDNAVYDSRVSCNAVIRVADNTLIAGCTVTMVPGTVRAIGPYAFAGCTELSRVSLPSSVTEIGYEAFGDCTSLTSIEIPATVDEVGCRAFAGCTQLRTLTVDSGNVRYHSPDGCNAVVERATGTLVAGCQGTTLPPSVTAIGYEAFSGCAALFNMAIPETVTGIGHYAFCRADDLQAVDIPATVTAFGDRAFAGCINLETITARLANPATAEYYNLSTFDDVDKQACTVYVPHGTVSLYQATQPWTPFFNIREIPRFQYGDVNADGSVDVADINILLNIVLGFDDADNYDDRAYILGNDFVDVSDVNALINLVISNK
ncbi:MAG: leucine-rich repeat protein [Muribaculaceae bacterium]|nr:leucine-rich repeat protein [Muribaculaceae bacterium]